MHAGSLTEGSMACSDCPPVTKASRISHVHEHHQSNHGGGAPGPELTPALHHLRHAEPRALGRMQRHENRTDEVPDDDGDTARQEGLAEERRRQRAGDDGQYVDVRTQPEREQVTRLPMPLVERDLIDCVLFDLRRPPPAASHGRAHRDGKSLASIIASSIVKKKDDHRYS